MTLSGEGVATAASTTSASAVAGPSRGVSVADLALQVKGPARSALKGLPLHADRTADSIRRRNCDPESDSEEYRSARRSAVAEVRSKKLRLG